MIDKEKRRKQLLKQTKITPPIHPRYQAVNTRLLEGQNKETSKVGSFGVRLVIAALLFALFVAMEHQNAETFHVDSKEIVSEIERDLLMQFVDR